MRPGLCCTDRLGKHRVVLGPVMLVKASEEKLHALHPKGQRQADRPEWEIKPMGGLSERHKTDRKGGKRKEVKEKRGFRIWNKVSEVSEARSSPVFGYSDCMKAD